MDSFDIIRNEISELWRGKQTRHDTVIRIAGVPAAALANFIIDAWARGWISNFNLGIAESNEEENQI